MTPILHHVFSLRPSTMLLALVVAANLALPLLYVGSDEPAGARAARSAPAAGQPQEAGAKEAYAAAAEKRTAAATESTSTLPVEPVAVPSIARRSVPAERLVSGKDTSPPPDLVCRAFGPFSERAAAEGLAAELALSDTAFRIVETEVRSAPEYLVTVRGGDSRGAAAGLMEALASENVETHLLDRPGVVLAAGVFSSEARAQMQRQRLSELGYEAAVEPFTRSARGYHLLARISADREVDAPAARACSDIAPPGQFL